MQQFPADMVLGKGHACMVDLSIKHVAIKLLPCSSHESGVLDHVAIAAAIRYEACAAHALKHHWKDPAVDLQRVACSDVLDSSRRLLMLLLNEQDSSIPFPPDDTRTGSCFRRQRLLSVSTIRIQYRTLNGQVVLSFSNALIVDHLSTRQQSCSKYLRL